MCQLDLKVTNQLIISLQIMFIIIKKDFYQSIIIRKTILKIKI